MVPELDEIDVDVLAAYKPVQPSRARLAQRDVPIDIASDVIDEAAGRMLTRFETEELDLNATAHTIPDVIKIAQLAGQGASMIPDFGVKFHFWGLGGDFGFGGTQLAKFASFAADVATTIADAINFQAGVAAKVGGYARREQDWAQQSSLAAGDQRHLKQLRAAQIREAMAKRDYTNYQQQVRNAADIERFLTDSRTGKTTNEAFYLWLKRETRGLYGRCFQLAYDTARKAERALQYELGDPSRTFLRYDYRSGMEELLAGERLYLDVARMELAYDDLNRREYEMTKHVSLRQLDARALIELRTTGQCTIDVDEAAFDLDAPGHYFRRLCPGSR